MGEPKFVVVMGASAGGLGALGKLVGQLEPELDAAFFLVLHLPHTGISNLLQQNLQRHTGLTCVIPQSGDPIQKGHLYIAPLNEHLLVKEGRLLLGNGPEENRWRPSIDVLFRSAAVAYNSRCVGLILTGMMDDGLAGMQAIRSCGGTCLVQDPDEAEFPGLPMAILNNLKPDQVLPLAGMGAALRKITQTAPAGHAVPEAVALESGISERTVVGLEQISELGEKSFFSCPDCGGGLWQVNQHQGPENPGKKTEDRYRCHIGHVYSEMDLNRKQSETMESTLWIALRIMEERRTLMRKIEADNRAAGFAAMAEAYQVKGRELQGHIGNLKELLAEVQKEAG